jgi:hypothetical protein
MENNRPLGITIIAGLMGLGAILSLCGNLAGLGFAPLQVFGSGGIGASLGATISSVVGLVLALGSFMLAWGLWTLKPWAFWGAVLVQVLNLFNGGWGAIMGARGFSCGINLIPLIILAYLFLDKDVRAAFRA